MNNRQFNTRQQYVERCRAENEALLASLPRKAWIQYFRQPSPGLNQRGAPRGVVIIYRKGSHLVAGGSFCHRRDRFDRHIGLRKAIRSVAVVPPSLDFGTAAPDHRWLAAFPQGCRATLRAMLVHCRAQEGRQGETGPQRPRGRSAEPQRPPAARRSRPVGHRLIRPANQPAFPPKACPRKVNQWSFFSLP